MYNRTWIFMYWSGLGNAHNYTFGIQFFFIPKTTCAPSHAEIMVLSLSSTPYQNFSLLRLTSWNKSKIKKSHSDSHLKFCVIATLHKLFEARFLNQDAFGQLAVKAAEKFTDELSGNKWHWFRQVKERNVPTGSHAVVDWNLSTDQTKNTFNQSLSDKVAPTSFRYLFTQREKMTKSLRVELMWCRNINICGFRVNFLQ